MKLPVNRWQSYLAIVSVVIASLVSVCIFSIQSRPAHADTINSTDFVTTWKTNISDPEDSTIYIPTTGDGYNYNVDWNNDGVFDEFGIEGNVSHDFGAPGEYTIRIQGSFPRIYLLDGGDSYGTSYSEQSKANAKKLVDINQWGSNNWTSMAGAFSYSSLSQLSAKDTPDLSGVSSMHAMFSHTDKFNHPIGSWDVSNITDMRAMFTFAYAFNQPLEQWDTSSVTSMWLMFYATREFNQPINSWNTANVVNMGSMFGSSSKFNQSLAELDISSVTSLSNMLYEARGFSIASYDATLIGWASQDVKAGVSFGFFRGRQYCSPEAVAARNVLINAYSWSIDDGGQCQPPTKPELQHTSSLELAIASDVAAGEGLKKLIAYGDSVLTFQVACANSAADDSLFAVNDDSYLITKKNLAYNPESTNEYKVCVQVTNSVGMTNEQVFTIKVKGPPQIRSVDFFEENNKKLAAINGVGLVDFDDDAMYEALSNGTLVKLNNQYIPFCADGTGMTAAELTDEDTVGFPAAAVSDDPPCFYYYNSEAEEMLFSDTQFTLWLPETFDMEKPGTIQIMNTPVFTFNTSTGTNPDPNKEPVSPTIYVSGSKALTKTPTIPARPTFSGVATPGANILVTVYSDPLTCSTVADADGNWSCTLPASLPPGSHTVIVNITNPDNSTEQLGPYSVKVAGDGQVTNTIDSDMPLAPNTGFFKQLQNSAVISNQQFQNNEFIQALALAAGFMVLLILGYAANKLIKLR